MDVIASAVKLAASVVALAREIAALVKAYGRHKEEDR